MSYNRCRTKPNFWNEKNKSDRKNYAAKIERLSNYQKWYSKTDIIQKHAARAWDIFLVSMGTVYKPPCKKLFWCMITWIESKFDFSAERILKEQKIYNWKQVKGKKHTHPTMLRPFSMNDASVGLFPLRTSSTRTPKL